MCGTGALDKESEMRAVILAIGDELITGCTADTNSAYLGARLIEAGVRPLYYKTLPDDAAMIAGAFREAAFAADVVIATGGLGPTDDDLSRQGLAEALGCGLEEHGPSLKKIEAFFRERRRDMPAINRRQALKPVSAEALENPAGTAPGIRARLGDAVIYVFPGVPAEMKVMYEKHVAPQIAASSDRAIIVKILRTFGMGESLVGERLGDMMRRDRNPLIGTTVSNGVVSVHIRGEYDKSGAGRDFVERDALEIRSRLGKIVFGEGDDTLEGVIVKMLVAGGKTVATAESCTGGLAAKMLTDVPGASDCFAGGWVAYSNAAKESMLGVAHDLLLAHGAVSEPVVRAMAGNAARKTGADYALALSGIAGPGGGTPEKPVGLVWTALSRRSGAAGYETVAGSCVFPGTREMVRVRAAMAALDTLRVSMLEE